MCERNKQNINLILNPKEKAWGLIFQGVNLGSEGGENASDKKLMKWVLALEWKSGCRFSRSNFIWLQLFLFIYHLCHAFVMNESWLSSLICGIILVCHMLSVYPITNNTSNYDATCQSNLLIIRPDDLPGGKICQCFRLLIDWLMFFLAFNYLTHYCMTF